jgi:hypothetical protein
VAVAPPRRLVVDALAAQRFEPRRGLNRTSAREAQIMKLGIMQPYFLPYLGYWQLMKAVDKYVAYDDVAYIKGGWINRNNLLVSGEKKLFSIALKGASSHKLINEMEIGDDFRKFLNTIRTNYAKAPFFRDVFRLLERIIACNSRRLSEFIVHSFKEVLAYLQINAEILVSSELPKDCRLKGKEKVIHICNIMGADTYCNAIGGRDLYDKAEFASHGIDLKFLTTNLRPYSQFGGNFIPGLSILDVLMFNSPDQVKPMMDDYALV